MVDEIKTLDDHLSDCKIQLERKGQVFKNKLVVLIGQFLMMDRSVVLKFPQAVSAENSIEELFGRLQDFAKMRGGTAILQQHV